MTFGRVGGREWRDETTPPLSTVTEKPFSTSLQHKHSLGVLWLRTQESMYTSTIIIQVAAVMLLLS